MEKRAGRDLLDRLGPDLAASVLRFMDEPADLVRLASVSKSWSIFVITNGFCKNLCLRMTPEISCFVRAIEVGSSPNYVEVGPNCSDQWQTLKSEHRIYSYLAYCIVSPKFLTEIAVESIATSNLRNSICPNMFSLTFSLSCKPCVVHEIKVQLPEVENLHFRLGHMRDEQASLEESLVGNLTWTCVSPEFSMLESYDFQSLKLQRPICCIDGILKIELLNRDSTDELPDISASQVKAIGCPLAPAFDVSLLDKMGNSILMYFPSAIQFLKDATLQEPSYSLKRRLWTKTKRRKKSHKKS